MTTIKATCPDCGQVSLAPEDIRLHIDRCDEDASSYAFTCPACGGFVRKPADERVIRLLVTGGVAIVDTAPTAGGRIGAGRRFDAPLFTHDDLLDFHTLLQRDDWFEQIEAAARR